MKVLKIILTLAAVLGAVRFSYGFGRFVQAKQDDMIIQAYKDACRRILKDKGLIQ